MGRATQGVTLIALDDGTTLSGLQKVVERESEGGNGHEATEPSAEGESPVPPGSEA
jgi:DNA gyrase subunit A